MLRVVWLRLVQTVSQPQFIQMFTALTSLIAGIEQLSKNVYILPPCKVFLRALQISTGLPTGNSPIVVRVLKPTAQPPVLAHHSCPAGTPGTPPNHRDKTKTKVLSPILHHIQMGCHDKRFDSQHFPLFSWLHKPGVSPHAEKADSPNASSRSRFALSVENKTRNSSSGWNLRIILQRASGRLASSKIQHWDTLEA